MVLGSALEALAFEPVTYKEIAMLLRNGEQQNFIMEDTQRRKLLQPLSPQEEKDLVSLGATPGLMNFLRTPSLLATPQAVTDYNARIKQQKITALLKPEDQPHSPKTVGSGLGLQQKQLLAKPTPSAFVGKPLNLKFTAADGSPVDLVNMRNKVVLVDFWATWCGPCMAEVPNVVAAYKKYHSNGFEIIGISLDNNKDTMLKVTREKEMTWPQYFDGKGWKNEISSSFQIHGIPSMWLVNKKGIVVTTEARGKLDAEIEKLLAE